MNEDIRVDPGFIHPYILFFFSFLVKNKLPFVFISLVGGFGELFCL